MKAKKVISSLLALAMSATMFTAMPSVLAETTTVSETWGANTKYPTHWNGMFNGTDIAMINEKTFIESTDYDSKSGNRSMLVKIEKESGGAYSIVTDLLETTDATKTYRLEFWHKSTDGTNGQIGGSVAKESTNLIEWNGLWNSAYTETVEDGWRKYSYTFTGQSVNTIGFQWWGAASYLIDDFKLYEQDGAGNDVRELTVVNGDFEDYIDFNETTSTDVYNSNWNVRLNNAEGVGEDYVRFEEISTGDYAMHIRYNDALVGNYYVEITSRGSNGQLANGTAYTVEYDIKQSIRGEKDTICFFPLQHWNFSQSYTYTDSERLDASTKSITALDNGFKHVVKEFTSSVSGDTQFAMLIQAAGDMIIDNIKVYASDDATKTNLIKDGDFSGTEIKPSIPETWGANTKYPTHWNGLFGSKDNAMINEKTFIESTDYDSKSGNRSMLVKIEKESGGTYSIVTDLLETTDATKTYRLEFWQKSTDGTNDRIGGSIAKESTNLIAWNGIWSSAYTETVEDGWRKYSYTFTGQSVNTIGFQWWGVASYLIDDFKLYEQDGAGNDVRELTVVNGDFEDYIDFNETTSTDVYNPNWNVRMNSVSGNAEEFVRYEDIGSGNYAMHIRYNDALVGNYYVEITSKGANGQLANGTAYTVEYDIKQSVRGELESIVFFPVQHLKFSQFYCYKDAERLDTSTKSVTALDNGFKHVVKEFTSSVSGDAQFAMLIQAAGDMIIDNIKVYASDDATKTNLIKDGDFSGIKSYNTTDLYNVVAYAPRKGTSATLSWTNPHAEISDVTVTLNDAPQTVTVDTTADAYNEILFENLTAGVEYTAVVSATINGETKTYERTVTPISATDISGWEELDFTVNGLAENWSSYVRDGDGYVNSNVSVETTDGNSYVVINGNLVEQGNTYVGIEQTVEGLDQYSAYQLSFRAKGEGITSFAAVQDVLTSGIETWDVVGVTDTVTDEWKTFTINFTGAQNTEDGYVDNYDARFLIFLNAYKGTLYIDDVTLYAVTDDELDDSTNLISNGSFTEAAYAVYGDPVFKLGNEVKTNLVTGTMSVDVEVSGASDLILIMALYKDGALDSMGYMEKTSSGGTETYSTSLIVPDMSDGVYTAKVMYWNKWSNIKPLRDAVTIGEATVE